MDKVLGWSNAGGPTYYAVGDGTIKAILGLTAVAQSRRRESGGRENGPLLA